MEEGFVREVKISETELIFFTDWNFVDGCVLFFHTYEGDGYKCVHW